MVVKRGPPTTVSLRLHLSFRLRDEVAECSDAAAGWAEANLNTDTTISLSSGGGGGGGGREACPVSCAGLAPLRAILLDARVTTRALLARPCSRHISSSPPSQQSPATAAGTETTTAVEGTAAVTSAPFPAPFPVPAELWAELEVSDVRSNAAISTDPALLSAWRLLLPHLVRYSREEAPPPGRLMVESEADQEGATPACRQASDNRECASRAKSGHSSSDGLEVRALDAVYASFRPAGVGDSCWGGGCGVRMAGADGAVAVGPAPGASGLNAVPAAVVMKVAQYLPPASLDALSASCKGQHHTCSGLVPGLKLDLFPHQKKGLGWMRAREGRRKIRPHPEFVPVDLAPVPPQETTLASDDHADPSLVRGSGREPGAKREGTLRPSSGSSSASGRLWVNVMDGMVREQAPAPSLEVRGGMLCDEPGLGKTITVLALLLRTRGLLPDAVPVRLSTSSSSLRSGNASATEQWQNWGSVERQRAMMKVVRALQINDPAGLFSRELDSETLEELGMPDYVATVGEPIDLQTIARRASSGPRDSPPPYDTFEEFASDVRNVFSKAIAYHGGGANDVSNAVSDGLSRDGGDGPGQQHQHQQHARGRVMPEVAKAAEELLREAEDLLRGAFVARRVRYAMNRSSGSSRSNSNNNNNGNLLSPGRLRASRVQDRGEAQAERLRSLKPSSATIIVVPPPMLPHWRNQLTLHAERGRLGPLFFDERSDTQLPPVQKLKEFGVVVTTYQRLTNEQPNWSSSPLSRIFWLRMVLDEGHAMGTSALTSCGDMARRVEAERRWVMTGTPTPTTSADAALRNLSNLLSFLRENEYSPDWRRNVRGPFMANRPEGHGRLRRLLSEVMIRHTKADLRSIPPPVRDSALLNMSQQETLAYNTIVSFVRSNLLLTSMEGKTSGWQDSLLNPANTKYAMEALTNIRLSCCGGGTLIPVVKRHHHVETLDMLRDLHAVGAVDVRRIDNFIHRATMGEVSSCQGCGEPLQLLHVTPCAHLVCVDCVDWVGNACQVCGDPYDVDDFQRIQPGFELKWMYNIREQERLHQQRRVAARLARQASPANQANPVPASPSSPDVAIVHQASQQAGGGASSGSGGGSSSGASPPGSVAPASPGPGGMFEEEDGEDLEMHSKAFYTIRKLMEIRDKASSRRGDYRPLKAIVFSQFLPVLNIVGDKFLREFGGFPDRGWQKRGEKCVAEFWGKNRARELERFRTDPQCLVLLLGKKGAHGLDLSFVTHMFLMDQIWDRSLETQVVARANRMGAKGSVSVVQLIMKDTMEEELRSYVNSDKKVRAVANPKAAVTAARGLRGSLDGSTNGYINGSLNGGDLNGGSDFSPRDTAAQGGIPAAAAESNGGVHDRFPATTSPEGGSTPSPSRKNPREKSPREASARKRARSGSGRRASGGKSLASSQQEQAKVHFLLRSLRSSKAAAVATDGAAAGGGGVGSGDGSEQLEPEEDEEKTERQMNLSGRSNGGGSSKGKGKGKGKSAARRGVTFAEDVVFEDHPRDAPQQEQHEAKRRQGGGAGEGGAASTASSGLGGSWWP